MYSIKNLLQSAQLRQALTRKASNVVSATSTPWIAGATFMGKATSQVATQMQYVAANGAGNSIWHSKRQCNKPPYPCLGAQ